MAIGGKLVDRSFISTQVHGKEDILFCGKKYKQVSHKINFANTTNTCWVSLGANKERERLFLDQNSDFISTFMKKISLECKGKDINVREVLEYVNITVDLITTSEEMDRNLVEEELDNKLDTFVAKQHKNEEGFVDLAIDELCNEKLLVCRHKALLAANVLGLLVKEGILPPGNVHQYRSDLIRNSRVIGAHTWSVYQEEGNSDVWICDPRWQVATKANSPEAIRKYNQGVLNRMLERLNNKATPLLGGEGPIALEEHIPPVIIPNKALTPGMIFDPTMKKEEPYDIPKELNQGTIFSNPVVVPSVFDTLFKRNKESSLIEEARRGNMEKVIYLCKNKATLNIQRTAKDRFGKTAFHYLAKRKDSGEAILTLLEAASWTTDPTTMQDGNEDTPLHILAREGNDEILELIDQHFKKSNWLGGTTSGLYNMLYKASFYQNKDGMTPIMIVLFEQSHNRTLISKMLTAMGANESDINIYKQLAEGILNENINLREKIKLEHPNLIGWNWGTLCKPAGAYKI